LRVKLLPPRRKNRASNCLRAVQIARRIAVAPFFIARRIAAAPFKLRVKLRTPRRLNRASKAVALLKSHVESLPRRLNRASNCCRAV
jgi:hypothetical protein